MARASSSETVLVKNAMQLGLGCIVWWILGYGFAFNNVQDNNFIGNERYAGHDWPEGKAYLLATCYGFMGISVLYIINGAVTERVQLPAYIVLTFFIMIFFWPVVVAWGWGAGWLYSMSMEFIDYGGACTVHVFAGTMALVGAFVVGKRVPKADSAEGEPVKYGSPVLFTAGSVLYFISLCFLNAFHAKTLYQRGLAFCNTWLAAGTAALVAVLVGTLTTRSLDAHFACILRGFIAGAISVSSMSINIEPWEAFVMGIIGGLSFAVAKIVLERKVDDVGMMAATHLVPGVIATFAVGLWDNNAGAFHTGASGAVLGTQTAGLLSIFTWALLFSLLLFYILKVAKQLPVSEDLQKLGLNDVAYGLFGYHHFVEPKERQIPDEEGEEDHERPQPIQAEEQKSPEE